MSCVDSDAPEPVGSYAGEIETVDVAGRAFTDVDSCALAAAEFATDDLCSLMCQPVLLAARVRESGTSGQCIQFVCDAPTTDLFLVGVCVP